MRKKKRGGVKNEKEKNVLMISTPKIRKIGRQN